MPVLGIESSAHTLGIGVVGSGKVLSNEKEMYRITDKGIIPARVADFHSENVRTVLDRALSSAKLEIEDIDAVGYTKGPGLGPCLRIGQLAARAISERYKIPIFPVNHAVAHVEVTKSLCRAKDPIALYVSGGNSQIIGLEAKPYKHYHIYGETLDIGVGNMFDSFAREAKLNPAWGSTVAKEAVGGSYVQMPYTVKGMDFTFTGIMTNALGLLKGNSLRDVAYSLQETSFSMLCEATERALLLLGKKELVLCGGVAQSARLQQMLSAMMRARRGRLFVADNQFNADNGAMIALVAEKMLRSGEKASLDSCDVEQRYRIDKVNIAW